MIFDDYMTEKLNHNQKRILKKCKDKIIKSNDLVYKYSTQ